MPRSGCAAPDASLLRDPPCASTFSRTQLQSPPSREPANTSPLLVASQALADVGIAMLVISASAEASGGVTALNVPPGGRQRIARRSPPTSAEPSSATAAERKVRPRPHELGS